MPPASVPGLVLGRHGLTDATSNFGLTPGPLGDEDCAAADPITVPATRTHAMARTKAHRNISNSASQINLAAGSQPFQRQLVGLTVEVLRERIPEDLVIRRGRSE